LLESDLIYEPRALDILIGFEQPDAILLSGPTGAGDEVYVESRDGMLVSMSKYREALGPGIAGELVGISKISRGLYGLVLNIAEDHFEESLWFDYETDGLVAAAHNWAIACPVINGLVWTEIDDAAQLERARTEVYPKLQQAD
jgi:2-aminoethylphosphonate-pyruvate transaminase